MIAKGCESVWEKQAEMKRGPPYVRRTKRTMRFNEKEGYVEDPDDAELEGQGSAGSEEKRRVRDEGQTEKRFLFKSKLAPWAMNLLGTEEDLRMGLERVEL